MDLAHIAGLLALGAATGFVAGLLGVGGGMIMVPFLTFNVSCNRLPDCSCRYGRVRTGGIWRAGLPEGTLGFVYLPALVTIALASVMTAPMGARTAHTLNTAPLKRIFSLLLFTLAGYMLYRGIRSA